MIFLKNICHLFKAKVKGFLFLIILPFLFPLCLIAQDFDWWNKIHNWDGVTPWNEYLILSPAFMGPNALPVPEIRNGSIHNRGFFRIAYEYHNHPGDKTNNIFGELQVPLFTEKVALNIQGVPIEYYRMDSLTRDLRKTRDFDGKGYANGDVYISTLIQLLKDHDKLPDILLTVNLKTASGNRLSAARYTDTPGYFFDISFGKSFFIKEFFLKEVRPYGLLGFYVWQTFQDVYFQNDALQYGVGIDLTSDLLIWNNAFGGYSGYIGNGDRPIVFRSTIRSNLSSNYNFEMRFQKGIRDFNFTSFRLSFLFEF